MLRKQFLIAIIVLALISMACSFTVNLPVADYQTGPTQTDEIRVPLPDSSNAVANVDLKFGAGTLNLKPGADKDLISGTATYNVVRFKPTIATEGTNVTISQGDAHLNGIPNIRGDIKNDWNFLLSNVPMNLSISAGAYQGDYELGGLSIQNLHITDGAAETRLSFSEPSRVEMSSFRYETGASSVKLTGLANANFKDMIFKSGAGDYVLDFSGVLQRDATVNIESGLSSLTIIVPTGTATRVSIQGGLTNLDLSGTWKTALNDYVIDGGGPVLTIIVKMGMGNLIMRNP
jgi:hypothetical protein